MTQKELDSAIEVLYEKAKETAAKGEIPISAVLLFPDGAVYAEGNAVEEKDNPLEHAEIRVINRASRIEEGISRTASFSFPLNPASCASGQLSKLEFRFSTIFWTIQNSGRYRTITPLWMMY